MSNINPWTLLVLGILMGWLIGWLLELWYFRRQRLRCQRESNRLEGQLRARNAELGAANSQIGALRGELGTRAKEIDALLYRLAKIEEQADSDLSHLEPTPLEPIPVWKATTEPNPATELHTDVVSDTNDDIETLGQKDQTQNPINTREISSEQWTILRAAGITTEEDLASLSSDDLERLFLAPEWQQGEDEILEPQVQISSITQPDVPDDLTLISGIGPKYADLLIEHGITTFAQLSASDPETLSTIFTTSVGRPPNVQSWIDQAHSLQAEN